MTKRTGVVLTTKWAPNVFDSKTTATGPSVEPEFEDATDDEGRESRHDGARPTTPRLEREVSEEGHVIEAGEPEPETLGQMQIERNRKRVRGENGARPRE